MKGKFELYNCKYCANNSICDLEARKDHLYNLRDGTKDCFRPAPPPVPPWDNSESECYGCKNHSYEDCQQCYT